MGSNPILSAIFCLAPEMTIFSATYVGSQHWLRTLPVRDATSSGGWQSSQKTSTLQLLTCCARLLRFCILVPIFGPSLTSEWYLMGQHRTVTPKLAGRAWKVRLVVPQDCRKHFGKSEIKLSKRNLNPAQAQKWASEIGEEF
ncbi:MAG: hypothetical protein VX152_09045, partial [Pseudomonadota bacterium]|nr:hypothetical protein [Pseudomonadota bacterium]